MDKYFLLIVLIVFSAILLILNPDRESFNKYFASRYSRQSESIVQAVASDVFVHNCLRKCEFRDLVFLSTVHIPGEEEDMSFLGIMSVWVYLPF